jgi:hypothetical protein
MKNQNQIIQTTLSQINILSQDLDSYRKNLVLLKTKVLWSIENDLTHLHLIPDLITKAVDLIPIQSDSDDFNDLSSRLADFIHSCYFIAKAKYLTVVQKLRDAAESFLIHSVSLLIDSISILLANANVTSLINTLRDVFLNNKSWINNLIMFFKRKANKRETEKEFIGFIDKVIKKISRVPSLMRHTIVYRELACDYYDDLVRMNKSLLDIKYPDKNAIQKFFLGLLILFFISLTALIFSYPYYESKIFSVFIALLGFFCIRYILLSWRKQKKLKDDELEFYKDMLQNVKDSGRKF